MLVVSKADGSEPQPHVGEIVLAAAQARAFAIHFGCALIRDTTTDEALWVESDLTVHAASLFTPTWAVTVATVLARHG